jgi:hypothetical protein
VEAAVWVGVEQAARRVQAAGPPRARVLPEEEEVVVEVVVPFVTVATTAAAVLAPEGTALPAATEAQTLVVVRVCEIRVPAWLVVVDSVVARAKLVLMAAPEERASVPVRLIRIPLVELLAVPAEKVVQPAGLAPAQGVPEAGMVGVVALPMAAMVRLRAQRWVRVAALWRCVLPGAVQREWKQEAQAV